MLYYKLALLYSYSSITNNDFLTLKQLSTNVNLLLILITLLVKFLWRFYVVTNLEVRQRSSFLEAST